jgi:8-hydroxy-5-deazaflavin:NADPH oxidoreductase
MKNKILKNKKMKIGILGSGDVGKALATGFIKYGYEVMIGTQHKEKLSEFKEKFGKEVNIGNFDETAKFGEMLVLAVRGTAAKETLKIAGEDNIKNKTIIDTTNPIAEIPMENNVLRFFTSLDSSLMEQLQKEFPNANFVKAFNSIGSNMMVNPDINGTKPTMFICGNNESSKKEVGKILDLFGFEIEDMGKAEAARAIEPLCILWCIPGFAKNDWEHAFKLLRK